MSIFDHPDTVQPAPSWRCPDCRTLQPETTRCWRCDKPAYVCESCHLYRASVAADLGHCAADPAGGPVRADEARSCWQGADGVGPGIVPGSGAIADAGLFADAELQPRPPVAPPPRPSVRAAPDRTRRPAKPTLETPGRAAWVPAEPDTLVEAPIIEPGKRITTELQRRRRWFR